ncbi:ABC transporter ATP-binding protein [Novipirellula artificiosorum]|uniref:ABC transporter ATP-binding protein n=1 Tax=Novipirellula artificiosorum TaxID=2528016 RepID=UPI0018CFEACC|nr:ABC transporter ATP-binding protein [Novipirellula artificiosorum]
MSLAIQFENISKQYRLGEIGTGTLSHDLHRAWARLRGKPDPFAQVGSEDATGPKQTAGPKQTDQYVWALRDVNLDVAQGEILGIIGHNGAGKSTLLKMLSRITSPTTGTIKARGRIASLLEVGTGFHPELTGRENVFVNGAILGMSRREIARQLDQIVDFSGCEKYLDTPVKRYSSGMMVRLGFAVAAHLPCDTLIVDEVLAVGDASFQARCLKKMNELSNESSRTILFVSHNLNAVQSLCTSAVQLDAGAIVCHGATDQTITHYLSSIQRRPDRIPRKTPDTDAYIAEVRLQSDETNRPDCIGFESPVRFQLRTVLRRPLQHTHLFFEIHSPRGLVFLSFDTDESPNLLDLRPAGETIYCVEIPARVLKPGHYSVTAGLGVPQGERLDTLPDACSFEISLTEGNESLLSYAAHRPGLVAIPIRWMID